MPLWAGDCNASRTAGHVPGVDEQLSLALRGKTVMTGNATSLRRGWSLTPLETRSVPSAGVTATLGVIGDLRINGTTAADDITVRQADGSVSIDGTEIVFAGIPKA